MGKTLVEQILIRVAELQWTGAPDPTLVGREAYEVGLDKVDEFDDDPETLKAALRIFHSGESRPYAYAGIAYTLVRASADKNGDIYEPGLNEAMGWLEEAQELAPDLLEINTTEALIYIYSGRYNDARLILNYLIQYNRQDFRLLSAEVAYWRQQGDFKETERWYNEAISAADSVPRKIRMRGNLGDFFLDNQLYSRALDIYKQTVHFSTENPWVWHNMSIAYWHEGDYEEAAHCNRRSLALADLPAARQMETDLKEKLDKGRLRGWLFGG